MVQSSDIITQLKTGTYPLSKLLIVQGEQVFRRYPSMEVLDMGTTTTETPELITTDQTFEVRLYDRYLNRVETENTDLFTTEQTVITLIRAMILQDGSFLFSQNMAFNRSRLEGLYGVQSVLRVVFRRSVSAFPAGGEIGAGTTLTLPGVTVSLIRESRGDEGIEYTNKFDDTGVSYPIKGGHTSSRFFTYAWNSAAYSTLSTLILNRAYVAMTLTENGVTRNFTVLPVRQSDSMTYAGLKTVTLQVEIQV